MDIEIQILADAFVTADGVDILVKQARVMRNQMPVATFWQINMKMDAWLH
jgi:hypothetical protein